MMIPYLGPTYILGNDNIEKLFIKLKEYCKLNQDMKNNKFNLG